MAWILLLWSLIVYAVGFWLVWWGLGEVDPPEPWRKVIKAILVVATVFIIFGLLVGFVPLVPFPGSKF